jgi:hypothetical protein
MKLFKISTLALAMALTGWVACGSNGNSTDTPIITIPGTGGTVVADGPSGSGGTGGALDGGSPDTGIADAPIIPPPDGGPGPMDTTGQEAGINMCNDLGEAACHLTIINLVPDPSVSALDPGPNPTVPYPNCAAQ